MSTQPAPSSPFVPPEASSPSFCRSCARYPGLPSALFLLLILIWSSPSALADPEQVSVCSSSQTLGAVAPFSGSNTAYSHTAYSAPARLGLVSDSPAPQCFRATPGPGLLLAEIEGAHDPRDFRLEIFDAQCRPLVERVLDRALPWILVDAAGDPLHICVGARDRSRLEGSDPLPRPRLALSTSAWPSLAQIDGRAAGHKNEDNDSTSDPIEPDPEGFAFGFGPCARPLEPASDAQAKDPADGIACAAPLSPGQLVRGSLFAEDLDVFRFEVKEESRVVVSLLAQGGAYGSLAGPGSVVLQLSDAEGRPVGRDAGQIDRLLAPGIWHLRLASPTQQPTTYALVLDIRPASW